MECIRNTCEIVFCAYGSPLNTLSTFFALKYILGSLWQNTGSLEWVWRVCDEGRKRELIMGGAYKVWRAVAPWEPEATAGRGVFKKVKQKSFECFFSLEKPCP